MVTAAGALVLLAAAPPVTATEGGEGFSDTAFAAEPPLLVTVTVTANVPPRVSVAGASTCETVSTAGASTATGPSTAAGAEIAAEVDASVPLAVTEKRNEP